MRGLLLCLVVVAGCGQGDPDAAEAAPSGAGTCRPAAEGWSFEKLGPVRGLPEPAAAGEGALSPAVVVHGDVLHLWYAEKTAASGYAMMHAESRDGGATFAPPARVTGLAAGTIAAYPSVWLEGDTFQLLYGSGSFKRASSPDGVHFTLAPTSVMTAGTDPARFDGRSILYPSVVHDAGVATLFFTGFDGQRLRIGRATAGADGRFSPDPPLPVIDVGAASAFDNRSVAQPHVARVGSRWWMWYGGYDTAAANPGPYRIGSASSADGITWEKHGVALQLSAQGTDAWSTRDPALVVARGRWLMFYVGMGDDGRYRLHRAASDVCATE